MRGFKIVAMAYVRVIVETIELLFEYLLFPISTISFSQVFSSFLFDVCVASFLYNVNPPHVWHCQQIGKKFFFSEPYCFALNRFLQEEW